MISKNEDGKYYFDHGKYSNIPLDHVPTEHLDIIIENFKNSNDLQQLKGVELCLHYKIKRIQATLDALNKPEQIEEVAKSTIRRR